MVSRTVMVRKGPELNLQQSMEGWHLWDTQLLSPELQLLSPTTGTVFSRKGDLNLGSKGYPRSPGQHSPQTLCRVWALAVALYSGCLGRMSPEGHSVLGAGWTPHHCSSLTPSPGPGLVNEVPQHHPAPPSLTGTTTTGGQGSYLVMLLTNFLSSTTTLSWQARGANTCNGSGNSGSGSPGAAARMIARLRVWATPY